MIVDVPIGMKQILRLTAHSDDKQSDGSITVKIISDSYQSNVYSSISLTMIIISRETLARPVYYPAPNHDFTSFAISSSNSMVTLNLNDMGYPVTDFSNAECLYSISAINFYPILADNSFLLNFAPPATLEGHYV